ncbi:serine protease [Salipaludibacillus keqinensis]|uniref:Serine protease n=1 Tax=Salipaludibacillus keqinensis TaxID=2045207 RepID=A0A323TLB1_9BACI|nr:CAP domain-containing protein [Salipaludibacillus keqinensis]PYZ94734.1 serine protease [Salipaludibacillus keqinensis]
MRKYVTAFLSVAIAMGIYAGAAGAYEYFDEPPFEAYKVSQGDSFFYIAQRYGLDSSELQRINSDVDPYNMQVGSIIRLVEEDNGQQQVEPADDSFEAEVVRLVNEERANHGLQPLESSSEVQNVAHAKSKDMVDNNYFSHTSPTYGSPFEMLDTYGVEYRTAGENIAQGQRSPEAVVNAWMNSQGHRENILNRNFSKIGVGHYENTWTQLFTD